MNDWSEALASFPLLHSTGEKTGKELMGQDKDRDKDWLPSEAKETAWGKVI